MQGVYCGFYIQWWAFNISVSYSEIYWTFPVWRESETFQKFTFVIKLAPCPSVLRAVLIAPVQFPYSVNYLTSSHVFWTAALSEFISSLLLNNIAQALHSCHNSTFSANVHLGPYSCCLHSLFHFNLLIIQERATLNFGPWNEWYLTPSYHKPKCNHCPCNWRQSCPAD